MSTNQTEKLFKRRNLAVPEGVGHFASVAVETAQGALLRDVDGREYIDFIGGIGVNNVGHRHPKVVQAIKDQAEKLLHSCFHVAIYEPYIELAEKLNKLIPCRGTPKTLFANSGAEAVENAVKIARYYTGRPGVVCFENGYHGRSLLCLGLTSKSMPYKYKMAVHLPGIYRAHYPYCYRCPWGRTFPECDLHCGLAYFNQEFFKFQVNPEEIAAIIIEPIQGEGGFINPPEEYLKHIREICDQHGIVMIVDEVQSGFARTGKMFATEHYDVEPDLVTTAKSLGGGLPLSAVTGTSEIMDSVHVGGLGGTYGGNPLSCRSGLAVLEAIESEDLVGRALKIGQTVRTVMAGFKERYEMIGDVRGLGAMIALELVKDRESKEPAPELAKQVTTFCQENGLLILDCGTLGNNIRTLMPLVITDDQLMRGLEILESGLEKVLNN